MYQNLKQFLLGIPYFNWITVAPLLLAFIAPSILEPEWFWRLFFILISSIGLLIFTLRVILVPDLVKKELVKGSERTKKVLFVVCYIGIIALLAATSYFAFKATVDLVGYQNLQTEKVLIEKTSRGGITALAGQTVYFNDRQYTLAYYWGVIKPQQEYIVTHSPVTNFIYEIHPY